MKHCLQIVAILLAASAAARGQSPQEKLLATVADSTANALVMVHCMYQGPAGQEEVSGMGVCYDCLVTIDGVPNQRACMTPVQDRMEIRIDE